MRKRLFEEDIIHIDETKVQCLKEPNRSPSNMSWAWLFCSGETGVPIYIFNYDTSRAASVPKDVIPSSWKGTIITDGHSAYTTLLKERPYILRVSCLVHIRRKFIEVTKGIQKKDARISTKYEKTASKQALDMIANIFHADNSFNGLSFDERKVARERELKPLMDDFMSWCREMAPKAMPKSNLDKALTYALNQFPYLYNALLDGRLPIENNRAERSIRPFTIGRKAWLFSDTQAGANASCGIYSIVCTAKENGLSPLRYIEWLLESLPLLKDADDEEVLQKFLPWSDAVPESCQLTSSEAAAEDPMQAPITDIDPHTLDED